MAKSLQSQIDSLKKDLKEQTQYNYLLAQHLTNCEKSIIDLKEKMIECRGILDSTRIKNKENSDLMKQVAEIREDLEDLINRDQPQHPFAMMMRRGNLRPREIRELQNIKYEVESLINKGNLSSDDVHAAIGDFKEKAFTINAIMTLTGKKRDEVYPYVKELIAFKNILIETLKTMKLYTEGETPASADAKIKSRLVKLDKSKIQG